jgi:hypothetical protein
MGTTRVRRGSQQGRTAEVARASRGLDELIAKGDRRQLELERKADPLLTVTLCELTDKNAMFAAEPWKQRRSAELTSTQLYGTSTGKNGRRSRSVWASPRGATAK